MMDRKFYKHPLALGAGVVIIIFALWAYNPLSLFKSSTFSDKTSASSESYMVLKMEQCSLLSAKKKCLTEMAGDLLDNFSLKEILAIFARNGTHKAFFTTCHEATHYLGQEAYRRIGSIPKIFEQSDETCIGGTFHGAIEGYFMAENLVLSEDNMEIVADEVTNICDEDVYGSEEAFRCRHGLGHALLYVTSDDVIKALTLCDNLDNGGSRDQCYTGVFMQNLANFGSADHPNVMLKAEEPLYPCNVLDTQYQMVCYTYAIPLRFQHDSVRAIALCRIVPNQYRSGCFMTFGRDGSLVSDDIAVLKERCAPLAGEVFYNTCIAGLAGQLVIRYGVDADLPFKYCENVEEGSKKSCFETLGLSAKRLLFKPEEIARFCERVDNASHRSYCMEGNGSI